MIALVALLGSAAVSAQTVIDRTSCGHFKTWEDSQAALDDPEFPGREVLDPDEDGIACESAFGAGEGDIPADQMACNNFDSQEAAQAHFDASTSEEQRNILDPDGDGIACEDAFGVVIDHISCGHFHTQEDAQTAFDDSTTSSRENLDADRDGIACEDRFGEPGTDSSTGQERVSSLPSTGSGIADVSPDTTTVTVALAITLILLAGACAYRLGTVRRN
jgi:hypothetical protein